MRRNTYIEPHGQRARGRAASVALAVGACSWMLGLSQSLLTLVAAEVRSADAPRDVAALRRQWGVVWYVCYLPPPPLVPPFARVARAAYLRGRRVFRCRRPPAPAAARPSPPTAAAPPRPTHVCTTRTVARRRLRRKRVWGPLSWQVRSAKVMYKRTSAASSTRRRLTDT